MLLRWLVSGWYYCGGYGYIWGMKIFFCIFIFLMLVVLVLLVLLVCGNKGFLVML